MMLKGDNERMALVQIYIHTNLADHELSLGFLAKQFGHSKSSLKRQFKSFTGKTVGQYIVEVRMEKARELLSNGTLNVGEVGILVGYSELPYFSRVFTKYFGYAPSKTS